MAWVSVLAALANSLWLLFIGLPITWSSQAEDMLLMALLFAAPQACALALQTTTLIRIFSADLGDNEKMRDRYNF